MSAWITGYGAALPERVVSNAELSPLLGVTPEWILSKCGVRERRWAAPHEAASHFALGAAREALQDSGVAASELDAILAGSLSSDYHVPGLAPLVQRGLPGCGPVQALDVHAACCALVAELSLATALIDAGRARHVLCVGAEAQSKGLDLHPRSAAVSMLFGDGGGAVVVSATPPQSGVPALRVDELLLGSDGAHAEALLVRAPGSANGAAWCDETLLGEGALRPSMDGRRVILFAVRKLAETAGVLVERAGLALQDVDLVVPHQANLNLLEALGERLGLPRERLVVTLDAQGNTSGASAFLALHAARQAGRLRPGARVLLLAFAAGFSWGGALCRVTAEPR